MKLVAVLAVSFTAVCLQLGTVARADERHEDQYEESGGDQSCFIATCSHF